MRMPSLSRRAAGQQQQRHLLKQQAKPGAALKQQRPHKKPEPRSMLRQHLGAGNLTFSKPVLQQVRTVYQAAWALERPGCMFMFAARLPGGIWLHMTCSIYLSGMRQRGDMQSARFTYPSALCSPKLKKCYISNHAVKQRVH